MSFFRRLKGIFKRSSTDKVSANPTPHPIIAKPRPKDKISANPTPHPKEIMPKDKISANPTPHPKIVRPEDDEKVAGGHVPDP